MVAPQQHGATERGTVGATVDPRDRVAKEVVGGREPREQLVEVRRTLRVDDHRRRLDWQQLQGRARDDSRQAEPTGGRLEEPSLLLWIDRRRLALGRQQV